MSKIKTLFEDSAKQTAIYPRTKFSAVSDTNGNTLGDVATLTSTTVVSGATSPLIYAQPFFVDTATLITSGTQLSSYTATQDCFITIKGSSNYVNDLTVDGVILITAPKDTSWNGMFVKSGSVVSSSLNNGEYKVFAIKH